MSTTQRRRLNKRGIETLSTDEDRKVIQLRTKAETEEGWSGRERDARLLALLGAMPAMDYERARVAAAKELRCRVSWLDGKRSTIWETAMKFRGLPPPNDGRTRVGMSINFVHNNGEQVLGFLVVAARERRGRDVHVVVLADGNGTVVESHPLSDERLAELAERAREIGSNEIIAI